MELRNTTVAAVRAWVGTPGATRTCMVRAKVSYRYAPNGDVTVDREHAFPLFDTDLETPLGLLPRDDLPLPDDRFSVIVLGAAYNREPAPLRTVSMRVGDQQRELAVIGDRQWLDRDAGLFTPPIAFARMPLTYDRAFGGRCTVLVDEDSPLEVSWPVNPLGRGFDADLQVEQLASLLQCPSGYPKYTYQRLLPNVEARDALIRTPDDTPLPAGWATLPLHMPLHVVKHALAPIDAADEDAPADATFPWEALHRAHPSWVIERPAAGAEVEAVGLDPEHEVVHIRLPNTRVTLDYCLGPHTGTREMAPYLLVMLPDERRFYVVYDFTFTFDLRPEEERSLRVRLETQDA